MYKESKIPVYLIIDNSIQSEYVSSLFDLSKYNVNSLANGNEAYRFMLNTDKLEAVFILSFQLDFIDGLSIMRKLRKEGRELAIIFLTADKTVERAIEAMKAGAMDFLPKTAKLEQLIVPMVDKVFFSQQKNIQQQQIKRELHENREKLRSTIDSINDYIVAFDVKDFCIDAHISKVKNCIFPSADKLLGKHISHSVWPKEFSENIKIALKNTLKTSQVQKFEFSMGNEFWFSVNVSERKSQSGEYNGATAVLRDFTDNKKAEIAIRLSEDKLRIQNAEIQHINHEIEIQRDKANEQNDKLRLQAKNIMASIHYAKRIQSAILPPKEFIAHFMPEHFIFYRPRDIVSGDFYWFAQKGQKIVLVAADCTGHGVPGAFMSMLGTVLLNEIVNIKETYEAGEILNLFRESLIRAMRQTGKKGEAADGMDVALCIIDIANKTVNYAGANNPLYIIRMIENESKEAEVEVIKADKMPIGIHRKIKNAFTSHTISLESGDLIYIFSDGVIDQFGGPKYRKYLSSNFKKLLLSVNHLSMSAQKVKIEEAFDKWKGDNKQIDDILVIGVRFFFNNKLVIESSRFNWNGKSILIVEDETFNFMLLEEYLSTTKVSILHAKNGKEAVEICRSETKINVILMDIFMPIMNGYEAIHVIKKEYPNIPIIVQTAFTMAGEKEKSFKAGCDDYITKPVNNKELYATIAKYI